MNKKESLKEDAGLTVEDLIEIEMLTTQVNVASEMLLDALRKHRTNYMKNKAKAKEEAVMNFYELNMKAKTK